MTTHHQLCLFVLLALTPAWEGCSHTDSDAETAASDTPGLTEAIGVATDAYIYGYPLVTMEMTRLRLTSLVEPGLTGAPMGQFWRLRTYPAVNNHSVTAPNADTLYATAWLDVSKEPWVFTVPDMGSRYFLLPMLDAWTDVFQVPGTRTTGGKGGKYAITGPGWSGTLPSGLIEYKSPTALVWIIGRIYCTGTPQDYAAVHALQDKLSLVPLGSYSKPYTPPAGRYDPDLDTVTAVRDQVDALDINTFFSRLAELMKTNPPSAEDAPMVTTMAKIGLVPGKDFDPSKLGALDKEAIKVVPKAAQLRIMAHMKDMGRLVNGWQVFTGTGVYGTNYLDRALTTAIGLGANRPQDAVYPTSEKDAAGKEYDGSHKYVMHIGKGQFPPVNGFWSLTMYDDKYFFVPNPLDRYNMSQRNKFVPNADGSVDLYLQAESPGKAQEANWLPAPTGKFIPMFRLYWPKDKPPSILDGSWDPPALTQVR